MSQLEIVGPVGIRKMHLEKTCDHHVWHEHNYDHTSVILRGRATVHFNYEENGKTVEGVSPEFGPGEAIVIKAKTRHMIKSMEPNTHWICIFSHRDFNGVVVEKYENSLGNDHAYT